MWGMISTGCGFGPGTWMPMRLQRALRYGTSRWRSRAMSSAIVAGGVILVMSVYIVFLLVVGRRWTHSADGGWRGGVVRVEGFQVIETCDPVPLSWEFGSLFWREA